MELKLQIYVCLLFAVSAPLKSQTPDEKYIITSGRYSKDIYVYKGDVTSLSQEASVTPTIIKSDILSVVVNIDTDVANSSILLLELESSCVYSLSRFSSSTPSLEQMKCGMSRSLGSTIVYDWVAGNIYWSDGIFHWIAVQPLYATDNHMYRILVSDATDISALAVDPINRYIFWFDKTPSGGRIERASLAGQQRKTILTNGLLTVYDVVADVTSQRIFWVDYNRYSIESANYEGLQRQVLYKENTFFLISLAVDKEHVCATLPRYNLWLCVNKISGELKHFEVENPRQPYGIAIFNKAKQPQDKANFCASATCQHFCVNGADSAICLCKEGYTLHFDGRSCSAKHGLFGKGIIVAYDKEICMLDFKGIIHGNVSDFKCTHTGLEGVEHVQINAVDHVVFYYDSTRKHIKSHEFASGMTKVILTSTGNISDLSFDWRQKKLYWSESNTGIIGRISVKNYISEIFFNSDEEVNDVSVDPYNRTVFWIEGKSKIFSSHMDEENNKTILSEGGTKSGLFFEVKSDRLFWIENHVIVSIKIDGSDKMNHKSITQSNQLIIYKSYFVWISGKLTLQTMPMTSDHSVIKTLTLPDKGTITGIAVFDENSQPTEKGACDVTNGGCDHICIVVSNGSICKCKFGFTLDSDKVSCITEPLNQDFLLATDLTHARIYQIAFQNGNIRTLDLPFVERPVDVRYDSAQKYLYWSEADSKKIMRARTDGKDWSIIFSTDFGTYPKRIELDSSNGYLYCTATDSQSSNKGYIAVIDTSTLNSRKIITGLRVTLALALYPSEGILFYTNYDGNSSTIYRAAMDGSSISVVFTDRNDIHDIVIDYKGDRLYWSMYNKILSSDMSGLNREDVATANTNIRCLLLAYPYIYYSSDNSQKVIKFDISKKQAVSWMSNMPEIGLLLSLDIYPKDAIQVNSLCTDRNGLCSTFCLPREKSKVCACQDGVSLLSDGRTCTGFTKCSGKAQFGSLEDKCQSYAGETCSFTCDPGYSSKFQPQQVNCQQNGTWDRNLSDLCYVSCSNIIPNGEISKSCSRTPGSVCDFTCNQGYEKASVNTARLTCLSSGSWNHLTDKLCRQTSFCDTNIPNGGFKSCILIKPGDACDFYCDDKYVKKSKSNVICTTSGDWSTPLKDLCITSETSEAVKDTSNNTPIIAGASVGGAVVIAIVVVIIIFLILRKKPARRNDTEGMARVYYTAQSRHQPHISLGGIGQRPPTYDESVNTKQPLPAISNSTCENPYTTIPTVEQENYYEELGAIAFDSPAYPPSNSRLSSTESPYLEAVNAGDYTSLMPTR